MLLEDKDSEGGKRQEQKTWTGNEKRKMKTINLMDRKELTGWAWWLRPVIPTLWKAEVRGLLQARSLRPA